MEIFDIRDTRVAFREGKRETTVLSNLNLTVDEGSFLVLMGPSGSGKTSIINLLAGFLPPTDGTVLYRGEDLYGMTEPGICAYRRREVGMVHQFFNLIPELTAVQNVMAALLVDGVSFRAARERSSQLLERMGLAHRLKHRPNELSGGEQQRVAIARAVANAPRVLLCDEPTGNLDARHSESILGLLSELHAKDGCTVIMVTHDPRAAKAGTRMVEV